MMRGYNKLIIGEDTGTHQNDVIWLYDFAVGLLRSPQSPHMYQCLWVELSIVVISCASKRL